MHINQVVALVLGGIACGFDWKSRRIPNLVTLGGAFAALAFGFVTQGMDGLFLSAQGWGVGFALFLPMFLLGGMGAGDVKLLACLGAWFGPQEAFWVGMYSLIAGGVMGIAVSLATGYLRQALRNVWMLLSYWKVMGIRPLPELTLANAKAPRLPYAIPIAVGAVAAVLIR